MVYTAVVDSTDEHHRYHLFNLAADFGLCHWEIFYKFTEHNIHAHPIYDYIRSIYDFCGKYRYYLMCIEGAHITNSHEAITVCRLTEINRLIPIVSMCVYLVMTIDMGVILHMCDIYADMYKVYFQLCIAWNAFRGGWLTKIFGLIECRRNYHKMCVYKYIHNFECGKANLIFNWNHQNFDDFTIYFESETSLNDIIIIIDGYTVGNSMFLWGLQTTYLFIANYLFIIIINWILF